MNGMGSKQINCRTCNAASCSLENACPSVRKSKTRFDSLLIELATLMSKYEGAGTGPRRFRLRVRTYCQEQWIRYTSLSFDRQSMRVYGDY